MGAFLAQLRGEDHETLVVQDAENEGFLKAMDDFDGEFSLRRYDFANTQEKPEDFAELMKTWRDAERVAQ